MIDLACDENLQALLARVGADLRIDPDNGLTGCGYHDDDKPVVRVTRDLADDGEDRWPLYGVVAHEVAHHLLGHLKGAHALAQVAQLPVMMVTVMAAVFCAGRGLLVLAALLAVLAGGIFAGMAMLGRWRELAADAQGAALLSAAGLPGARVMLVALEKTSPKDSLWRYLVGWLWNDHPTLAARRRRLRAASPLDRRA